MDELSKRQDRNFLEPFQKEGAGGCSDVFFGFAESSWIKKFLTSIDGYFFDGQYNCYTIKTKNSYSLDTRLGCGAEAGLCRLRHLVPANQCKTSFEVLWISEFVLTKFHLGRFRKTFLFFITFLFVSRFSSANLVLENITLENTFVLIFHFSWFFCFSSVVEFFWRNTKNFENKKWEIWTWKILSILKHKCFWLRQIFRDFS